MGSTDHLKVSPTLIVGLGGTGSLGVQYAKRKIRKQLKKYARNQVPEKVPFIEYLVMDTTSQEEFVEDFTGDEHQNLGHINVPRILSGMDRKPAYAEALHWFPRHINPGQIDSGARGVRHIGRLCFFDKLPIIERSIRNKVQSITDYTAIDKSLKEHFLGLSVSPGSTIDVHIVTSLCGGTGSACLLDTAYLIKDIIREVLKQSTNSTAHLVTTEPFIGDSSINSTSREYISYNFAVALSEIERFMDFDINVGEAEDSAANGRWEVKYLGGRTVTSVEKPFSVTYLLGYKEGETIRKKNVCEIIGDTIALHTVRPERSLLKGLVDNAKAHVLNQKAPSGQMRAYSSYNTRILSAEFSEQTIEVSTVLASEAILDAVCKDGAGPSPDDVFAALRSETHTQSDDHSFVFELSKEKFRELYDTVDVEFGITKDLFVNADKTFNKSTNRSWWSWGPRERTLEDKISRGRDRYNLEKEARREGSHRVIREFEAWLVMIKREIPGKIAELLENGERLGTVQGSLRKLADDTEDIMIDLNVRRAALADAQAGDGTWIKGAISGKRYSDEAATRLRAEILTRVYNSFDTGLREIKEFVLTLMGKCDKAEKCLSRARDLLKEKSSRSASLTESSFWTKEKVANKIKEQTPTLVKSFVKELERGSPEVKEIDRRIAFLWHLDPDMPARSKEVLEVLRQVARDVVAKEIQIEEIDFNRGDGGGHQDVVGGEEINRFIELSAPTWQIERSGEDIAEISITNCPEETMLGQIISNMGKSITFSDNRFDPKQIILFRSEHGVSADRLLNIDQCMDAVRRKLIVDQKAHISDLSLNPAWQIEDPGTALKVDTMYTLFSLAIMFELIEKEPDAYFFCDKDRKKIPLEVNTDHSRNAERSAAFSNFLRKSSKRDKEVLSLVSWIEAQWGSRRQGDIEGFKQEVTRYIEMLEEEKKNLAKSQEQGSTANEILQFGKEIASLWRRVIHPLEEYLGSEELRKKKPEASGVAAGQ